MWDHLWDEDGSYTCEEIVKSIRADVTALKKALKDEGDDTVMDQLLKIAALTSGFVAELHSDSAVRAKDRSIAFKKKRNRLRVAAEQQAEEAEKGQKVRPESVLIQHGDGTDDVQYVAEQSASPNDTNQDHGHRIATSSSLIQEGRYTTIPPIHFRRSSVSSIQKGIHDQNFDQNDLKRDLTPTGSAPSEDLYDASPRVRARRVSPSPRSVRHPRVNDSQAQDTWAEAPAASITGEFNNSASVSTTSARASPCLITMNYDASADAIPPQSPLVLDKDLGTSSLDESFAGPSPLPSPSSGLDETIMKKCTQPAEGLEVPPAKSAKKAANGAQKDSVNYTNAIVRVYYELERSDIPIDHPDQPESIDVEEKYLFKYMPLMQTLFKKKAKRDWDLRDAICWDITVSKSTKPFLAPKAAYIKNFIDGATIDKTHLKNQSDYFKWNAMKIFCSWLRGNGIVLNEYMWKVEKGSTRVVTMWFRVRKVFLKELGDYEGDEEEQKEFVDESW